MEICEKVQSEAEQRPHKVSFYIEKDKAGEVMKTLSENLEKHGVRFFSVGLNVCCMRMCKSFFHCCLDFGQI